ncbi:hypothetical protein Leryth_015442 [Lithospermum erythrorhizon]|uniref:DUF4228 domain protein n=1 Tax=Lithospermum erythrorhizon TaxID=34254 RepID=A0AAV3RAW2_LITER|nr:hypothetical protein Leryth_015442 [Lithospermum erythrorhizon]
MGNYISCSLSSGNHAKAAKVVFPTGEIKEFKDTIKAAELMFESPNFFLVNAKSLQIGRRFSALNADEDLEMANVYVMFPMKRLNSIVTTSDMGALFLNAKSSAKKGSFGTIRVLPECNDDIEVESSSKLNHDDIEEYSVAEIQHRRSSFCRSKKPLLDTIIEEPGCSR